MIKTLCSGKIHRATVTQADLNYVGSITIDKTLMDAAGFIAHEQVHVVNVNNGARFTTYVIEGKEKSGVICVNGAASRHVQPGDKVIIIAYAQLTSAECTGFTPQFVFVDENNTITS